MHTICFAIYQRSLRLIMQATMIACVADRADFADSVRAKFPRMGCTTRSKPIHIFAVLRRIHRGHHLLGRLPPILNIWFSLVLRGGAVPYAVVVPLSLYHLPQFRKLSWCTAFESRNLPLAQLAVEVRINVIYLVSGRDPATMTDCAELDGPLTVCPFYTWNKVIYFQPYSSALLGSTIDKVAFVPWRCDHNSPNTAILHGCAYCDSCNRHILFLCQMAKLVDRGLDSHEVTSLIPDVGGVCPGRWYMKGHTSGSPSALTMTMISGGPLLMIIR